jgi:hypothetical protein
MLFPIDNLRLRKADSDYERYFDTWRRKEGNHPGKNSLISLKPCNYEERGETERIITAVIKDGGDLCVSGYDMGKDPLQ